MKSTSYNRNVMCFIRFFQTINMLSFDGMFDNCTVHLGLFLYDIALHIEIVVDVQWMDV